MSQCYNCGAEFTMRPEEIKCDNCHKIVNFPCYNCGSWFQVYDESTDTKIKECGVCGFFECPSCGVCGDKCQKGDWGIKIKKILESPKLDLNEKIKTILDFIEEIKIGKVQRECPRRVPISYAKGRIKTCIVRMRGYRTKDNEDMKIFSKRVEEVLNKNLGEVITINQAREKGSYGQEFRDVFNYCLCEGILEKINIKKVIDNEEIEYEVYRRCEKGPCPLLDLNELIIKKCPNPQCKIRNFPISQETCADPRCNYKTGKNKGQPRRLKLKISNKDICKLNRGSFIKREDAKSKPY